MKSSNHVTIETAVEWQRTNHPGNSAAAILVGQPLLVRSSADFARLRFPQEGNLQNVYEVLREKERAIERVRREIEALRSVSPLLADKTDARLNLSARPAAREESTDTISQLGEALRTVAPLLADETEGIDPAIRARLIEAGENDSKLRESKKISRHLRLIAAPLLGSSRR